ncbi:MAG: 4a-hydroxytetrahydrobiopterin dehydratase [Anaerolineae bacterium]|jgi:4a-hydroxytetrahydrobiopterin dehydratase|nr:4a-hydroxytetrahydrobiopterin dehydratase [Anaerolineae bacterium]MBL8105326.1 4a-hydroxytetrahydrobiopterin dehydratase [Anaerolineales bacterium]MCC7188115.1 4a-hydroxytetrahydrobiopterin dehydratase [Anaerolineales bacterium]
MRLAELKCVACRGGDPSLTEAEIAELLPQVPEWQLVERDDIPRLQRIFKFKNYAQSLDFTNKVAAIAEEQDHHPLIVLEWGRVMVQWWTHVVKGLHKNDFIMAAKTDNLFS